VSVYTERLFLGEVPVSWTTLLTVPAGSKYILRDIEIFSTTALAGPLYLSLTASSGGSAFVFGIPNLAANTHVQWDGRVTMSAGDELLAYASSSGPSVIVTGYVFPS
jgi:hypothetical protein